MNTTAVDDLEPSPYDESLHSDRRDIGDALNAGHVAIVRYVLEPGDRFSGSVHAHMDQEEVFVVLEGEATFEVELPAGGETDDVGRGTDPRDDTECREISVGANEAVRFAPGEFQSGRNDTDDRVVALALGAPRDTEDIRLSRVPVLDGDVTCPDCGHPSMRLPTADGDEAAGDGDEAADDGGEAVDNENEAADDTLECPACGTTTALE